MRILTFTSLYPNNVQATHGIFVESRIRELARTEGVSLQVVAPCPWFPLGGKVFGRYGEFANIVKYEARSGIPVYHPRFPLLPKVGMSMAPFLMYAATKPVLRHLVASGGSFDLIDAHYFYPDGVAAALLGSALDRPTVITARGTDINLIAKYRFPRRMIQWAAGRAAAVITVCAALKDALVALDVPAEKIAVLRNGVDLDRFRPVPRQEARDRLGLATTTLLSVGNLVELKGHDLVIRALAQLPDLELLIVGGGPEEATLRALADEEGVSCRVRFLGRLPQDQLPEIYTAADILVLASSREGWANVLLEAMACGTPCVATRVGGTPEVITSPVVGEMVDARTPAALAEAVIRLLQRKTDRAAVRAYAEQFSWDTTTRGQLKLFRSVIGARRTVAADVQ
jgi:teichuronic acid biosynthesis glycosyltransferase TuaC